MLTFLPLEEIDRMDKWEGSQLNTAKEILAFELTKLVHGEEEAVKCRDAARAIFGAGSDSEHMPTTEIELPEGGLGVLELIKTAGFAASNGEARRLVQQGGVTVDDRKLTDPTERFTAEAFGEKGYVVVKKGKKGYHKVALKA